MRLEQNVTWRVQKHPKINSPQMVSLIIIIIIIIIIIRRKKI